MCVGAYWLRSDSDSIYSGIKGKMSRILLDRRIRSGRQRRIYGESG